MTKPSVLSERLVKATALLERSNRWQELSTVGMFTGLGFLIISLVTSDNWSLFLTGAALTWLGLACGMYNLSLLMKIDRLLRDK